MRRALVVLMAWGCATTPQPAKVVAFAPTAMSVADLQLAVARGPFPDDVCQAAWFYAVADTRKASEVLDVLVRQPSACAEAMARVRLVQLARADTLSWATESRAEDVATRLELARFAATSKWEPGTSAVADLVNDADAAVRQAAVTAIRALRQSIAVGQLEKSLLQKPPRAAEERAALCTALTEFNIDVPPAACRGLQPVAPFQPAEAVGKPPPNLCRTLISNLGANDPTVQRRALLELAEPWVLHRDGCSVSNAKVLSLVQRGAPEVRAAAAMLLLWSHHPADMRRVPKWVTTVIAPD